MSAEQTPPAQALAPAEARCPDCTKSISALMTLWKFIKHADDCTTCMNDEFCDEYSNIFDTSVYGVALALGITKFAWRGFLHELSIQKDGEVKIKSYSPDDPLEGEKKIILSS